jgi:hypothetical protein
VAILTAPQTRASGSAKDYVQRGERDYERPGTDRHRSSARVAGP